MSLISFSPILKLFLSLIILKLFFYSPLLPFNIFSDSTNFCGILFPSISFLLLEGASTPHFFILSLCITSTYFLRSFSKQYLLIYRDTKFPRLKRYQIAKNAVAHQVDHVTLFTIIMSKKI